MNDQHISRLLERVIKDKGHEVFIYRNPNLCQLQHSPDCQYNEKQQCVDVVITDIDTPNDPGLEFIEKQLDKEYKIYNIAVVTGKWPESRMKRAKALGCCVFKKPFDLPVIKRWLDKCEKQIDSSKNISNWFIQE